MAQYNRLCSSYPMIGFRRMHSAMAMIELIFAIVIIAISVMTIPTMMSIANNASKGMAIDDDIMARLSGWTLDKFQARWDGNYSISGSGALNIATIADLNCSRGSGTIWYRIGSDDNISSMQCNILAAPTAIPVSGTGVLANGIEQLNGGTEPITITSADGTSYNVNATYGVRYVNSNVVTAGNTATATWILGSSNAMSPDGSLTTPTHLKRIVTRFNNPATNTDIVLTFFKSNKGN